MNELAQATGEQGLPAEIGQAMTRIRVDVSHRRALVQNAVEPPIPWSSLPVEIATADASATRHGLATAPNSGESGYGPAIAAAATALAQAEGLVEIGKGVPEMVRYGPLARRFARIVSRGVLFLTRFLSNRQTEFNKAAAASLRHMHAALVEADEVNRSRLDRLSGQLNDKLAALADELRVQSASVTRLLDELQRTGVSDAPATSAIELESSHALDGVLAALDERFGPAAHEKTAVHQMFAALLREAGLGTREAPILDLRCGRGDWLAFLASQGMHARGIDSNRVAAERCRGLGLDVTAADAMSHLRGLPADSQGAISAWHVIEQWPPAQLVNMLDEIVRVLKPGGAAILVTPNPANVLVGSCHFHLWPNRCRPLPAPLVEFLAHSRGLERVRVVELNPLPQRYWLHGSPAAQRLNELVCGPQDYAMVGWKV